MRRIGIITFHRAHNYGAMLQAFALSNKLKENNEVEIINYYDKRIYDQYKIVRPLRKNPIKLAKQITNDLLNYRSKKERFINFENFINTKCKLSKSYTSKEQLVKEKLSYDIMITGSDQVWNKGIVGELSDIYTLNFEEKNIKRVSYAASVGDSSQISANGQEFKEKISKIDHISVREQDAKEKLTQIMDKPIEVVLDPTLLLTKTEWEEEIKSLKIGSEKYILAYVVEPDEEYIKIVNDLSEKTGLKVLHFGVKNPGYKNVLKSVYTEGPLEFVKYIKNAEYVVATSFHATVFSILFNKKFFIIPHKKTGARVTNLLEKLEIKNRTFNSLEEFKNIDYNFETDWKSVNTKLEEERKKSITWLENAINS